MTKKGLFAFVTLSLLSTMAAAEVCVYQHAGFSGNRRCFAYGETSISNFDRTGFNDEISSISMTEGESVTVYTDSFMRGSSRTFTQSVENLADWGFNDTISSLQVRYVAPQRPDVCFYEHAGFSGQSICVGRWDRGIENLDRTGMNDKISAIQLPYGVSVTVCEDSHGRGQCRTFDRSVNNLSDYGFNDTISSIYLSQRR